MAAKVVLVVVPTVLGIASIRVRTESEAPADGLPTREKLNVYTPLQSGPAPFVPDSPGIIENGVTTVREGVLPLAQAVKGACVSVKKGSIDLYHTGQDVYFYLKDPPPGFLPRIGTITMAGLLGMFVARKGSRFKRLAVPLGLMSAGASVCYPAQAVAVIKVTGRKVYATGQWSSAAVSSLFASKPQPLDAKEMTDAQPQAAAASDLGSAVTEASAVAATIQGTAESVPVSDEPAAAITKEPSAVTSSEISPDHAPPESSAGPAETETAVENVEPSDTKQVSNESGPAESTLISEPEPEEVAPHVPSTEAESIPPSPEPAATVENVEPTKEEIVSNEGGPAESTAILEPEPEPDTEETAPVQSPEEPPPPVENVEPSDTEQVPEVHSDPEFVAISEPEAEPAEVLPVQSTEGEPPVPDTPTETEPVEESAEPEAGPEEAEQLPDAAVDEPPASTPAAPSALEEPATESSEEPLVESTEPEASVGPEEAEQLSDAAADEAPASTPAAPAAPEEPAAQISKGGSRFKADPALLDFGQSSPEDEDLYSTRS